MHPRYLLASLSILTSGLLTAGAAFATNYYAAPLGAVLTCTSDGSQACPFASIDKALASGKLVGGDTLFLMDGNFGPVAKVTAAFSSMVTIQSLNDRNAHLSYVHFDGSAKNIRLKNLTIWRDDSDTGTGYLIRSYDGASYLTFENLDIRSRADSTNYMNWSMSRWLEVGTVGVTLSGTFNTVRGCTVTGVAGGIYVGSDSLVENNVVDGFYQDGMKGVSRSVFRGNLVKNIVNADPDYHSDGFQSYSTSTVTDLTLERNTFLQWTGDPANPLKGSLQGIGMFDGWYDNILIQNNLVVTDHYHGISVYGTRGAKILNNTVVDLSGLPNTSPWIKVDDRKDGSPSQDVLVANNVAMAISVSSDPTRNIVLANNSVILDPTQMFTNIKAFDYRPTAASGLIDTGSVPDAPTADILGAARPFGGGPDRGAYEAGATSGTSGGTTTGGTTGGTTTGGTTGGTTTDGGTSTSGGTTTTDGGTSTSGGGTTTTDGGTTTTTGGNIGKGWFAKFLKPPKK